MGANPTVLHTTLEPKGVPSRLMGTNPISKSKPEVTEVTLCMVLDGCRSRNIPNRSLVPEAKVVKKALGTDPSAKSKQATREEGSKGELHGRRSRSSQGHPAKREAHEDREAAKSLKAS